jgi:hypothetical protein
MYFIDPIFSVYFGLILNVTICLVDINCIYSYHDSTTLGFFGSNNILIGSSSENQLFFRLTELYMSKPVWFFFGFGYNHFC